MSAKAISLTQPRSEERPTSNFASKSPKKTLNRYLQIQPEKAAKRHACMEKFLKVAAIASLVAFILIAAVATVFLSLLATPYIPIVAVSALCLAPYVYQQCYLKMRKCSEEHGKKAVIERGVADELKNLPSNDAELRALLPPSAQTLSSASLTPLRPAIARLLYWEKLSEGLKTEAEKKLNDTRRVNQEEEKDPTKVRDDRIQAFGLLEEAETTKVRAAFLLAVLLNPNIAGDSNNNEQYSFKPLHPGDRLTRRAFDDPSWDRLVQCKDKSPLGIEELRKMNVEQVYRRLF